MQHCEDNISTQISKLKEEIKRTKQTTRENENELHELYEKRIKELENHFAKLQTYLKEESKHRVSQIERLIKTLIEIRDAMKSTRHDLQSLLRETKDKNFGVIVKAVMERHDNSLYRLNITIPEYLVQIEPGDTFLIRDSISISAPDMPQVSCSCLKISISQNLIL